MPHNIVGLGEEGGEEIVVCVGYYQQHLARSFKNEMSLEKEMFKLQTNKREHRDSTYI